MADKPSDRDGSPLLWLQVLVSEVDQIPVHVEIDLPLLFSQGDVTDVETKRRKVGGVGGMGDVRRLGSFILESLFQLRELSDKFNDVSSSSDEENSTGSDSLHDNIIQSCLNIIMCCKLSIASESIRHSVCLFLVKQLDLSGLLSSLCHLLNNAIIETTRSTSREDRHPLSSSLSRSSLTVTAVWTLLTHLISSNRSVDCLMAVAEDKQLMSLLARIALFHHQTLPFCLSTIKYSVVEEEDIRPLSSSRPSKTSNSNSYKQHFSDGSFYSISQIKTSPSDFCEPFPFGPLILLIESFGIGSVVDCLLDLDMHKDLEVSKGQGWSRYASRIPLALTPSNSNEEYRDLIDGSRIETACSSSLIVELLQGAAAFAVSCECSTGSEVEDSTYDITNLEVFTLRFSLVKVFTLACLVSTALRDLLYTSDSLLTSLLDIIYLLSRAKKNLWELFKTVKTFVFSQDSSEDNSTTHDVLDSDDDPLRTISNSFVVLIITALRLIVTSPRSVVVLPAKGPKESQMKLKGQTTFSEIASLCARQKVLLSIHNLKNLDPNAFDQHSCSWLHQMSVDVITALFSSKQLTPPDSLKPACGARRVKHYAVVTSCASCGNAKIGSRLLKICGGCKMARYCSKECQHTDWQINHSQLCLSTKSK